MTPGVDEERGRELRRDRRRFAAVAHVVVRFAGSVWAVVVTLAVVLAWIAVGFPLRFSRGWELAMTVGVPVLTLGLLIGVQHTQNHDNLAMQLKLDELIRAHDRTEDQMIRVEDAVPEDLERLEQEFQAHAGDSEAASDRVK
jgi:low affinity Fe/Cu permease